MRDLILTSAPNSVVHRSLLLRKVVGQPRQTLPIDIDVSIDCGAEHSASKRVVAIHSVYDEARDEGSIDVLRKHPQMRAFLNAIRFVETGNVMPAPSGDGGKSIGPFQISRAYHQVRQGAGPACVSFSP